MGRNLILQVLRGTKAVMPALFVGEFYLATDTGQLFIGTSAGNKEITTVVEPTYYFFADSVTFTQFKSFLSVFNGVGSGKVVKIYKLSLVNLQLGVITGVGARFNLSKATARTGAGTSVVPFPADSTNAAIPSQIAVEIGASLTVGGIINAVVVSNDDVVPGAMAQEPIIVPLLNLVPSDNLPNVQPITLHEGEGVLVQMMTNTTVGSFGVLATIAIL